MQIALAVEEIFVNIASYAYQPQTGQATVRLEQLSNPPAIKIALIDRGMPYNPLERPDPDLTLPVSQRQVGGLGIYMTKELMDEVHYERIDDRNVFTMVKRFGEGMDAGPTAV